MKQELDGLADRIIDKISEIEGLYIKPAFVIIGRVEYTAIIDNLKEGLAISKDGMTIYGLPLVPDFESESRLSIVPHVGLMADRQLHKKGLL